MAQFGLNGVLEHIYTSLHGGNHYPTPDQALAAYNAAIAALPAGVDSQAIGLPAFAELVYQQLASAGVFRTI
jgi:hypothetical protein